MTSDQKLSSNRKNAQKSTGPRSEAGKRRAARNALNHGLANPVQTIPELRADIETLAMMIARASGEKAITELSRQAAEAQLEIFRIRKVRRAIHSTDASWKELSDRLAKLDRYERRAFSRRKQAIRALSYNLPRTA